MRKFMQYITVFFLLIGCNTLDITPDGRMELDDVFQDEIRTEAYLNTVYSSIPNYFYKYHFWTFLAGITDEAQDVMVGVENSNIASQWINAALTPSRNPLETAAEGGRNNDRYAAYWRGIRHANVFLDNIDNANVQNELKRSRMKAEALALRAFYYLELIKQFGPMPIIDKPFPSTYDYTVLKRATFQEVVHFIVADCDAAIANADLPMRILLEVERGRFTKAVAYAIKSQALLYNASPLWNPENDLAKWSAAANASKVALSALTEGGLYRLSANYGDYFLMQSDINNSPIDRETIFEIKDEVNNISNVNSIPSKPGMTKAGVCPSQELVDSYDMQATGEPAILGYRDDDHLVPVINEESGYDENDPYTGRDPRFYATVWYNGARYDNVEGRIHTIETFVGGADQLIKTPSMTNTRTGYYLRKFVDPRVRAVWQAQNARWKKYRLAEIYLNYAEAENEATGPSVDVYEAINTVRRRADMPELPPGLTKEEMRDRIRRERRVELAIEEHRFWDVRRWKILDQTDKLVTGMEIRKDSNNSYTYKRFVTERRNAWEDKYLIFPIPINDASNIPDFGANQNPGW